ncbi:MAG: formylglycine-generating enzyme family protein [Alphaproteobacteria bacterium]
MNTIIGTALLLVAACTTTGEGPSSSLPDGKKAGAKEPVIFRDCPECPEMVVVEPGTFTMGAATTESVREKTPEEISRRERPQHKVTLAEPFALGRYPVTRAEFEPFAKATGFVGQGCIGYDESTGKWEVDKNRDWQEPGYTQTDRDPVVCVSWDDAQAYVRWLSEKTGKSYGLPSEARWEYAARAGTRLSRYWGDVRDRQCENANGSDQSLKERINWVVNPCKDGFVYTSPVGSFRPNEFGLYDMLGNVLQWTQDCWNDTYTAAPTDGSPWMSGACQRHPLRGGAWSSEPRNLRAAYRERLAGNARTINAGIRLIRSYP